MKHKKSSKVRISNVVAEVLSRLFKGKEEDPQKQTDSIDAVEVKAAVQPSDAAAEVIAEQEVVPDEDETEERLENDAVGETESNDDEPPGADSRYNEQGLDCAGYSRDYYESARNGLLNQICEAAKVMQAGHCRYACSDARSVADNGLKMLLRHNGLETAEMKSNIEVCRLNGLITDEMADSLHGVRKLGNFSGHDMYAVTNLTHEQAWFALMQTLELMIEVEKQLLWPEPLPELAAEWEREPVTLEEVMTENKERRN